jgi:hypothetical protein
MPKPASIAWRPAAGGDEIWVVTTNSAGAIIGYSTVVAGAITGPVQWNAQNIAKAGSATVPSAPQAPEAPAVAFGGFGTRFFPLNGVHVAAGGPNGVVYYSTRELVHVVGGPWPSQNVTGATGSVVGITVMPDDWVFILTVSSGQELMGWLGNWDNEFKPVPIPTFGTTTPAPANFAAMTVRSVNSSQIEVHAVGAAIENTTTNELTYFWSTYTAGSGGNAGSFTTWQSNNIAPPTLNKGEIVYPDGRPSIALGPNGQVVVTAPVNVRDGTLAQGSFLYYFVANSPGSTWFPTKLAGPSGVQQHFLISSGGVAVDDNGIGHSLVINASTLPQALTFQPEVTDYTLPQGGSSVVNIPVDTHGVGFTADPLDWTDVFWSADGYSLSQTGQKTNYWGQDIIPGMTVRANGEVDVAFWNFPFSSVALFSLPLGGSSWFYGRVGYPDQ